MQTQGAPPALPAPTLAQIPTAQATHTSPAVPAHIVQAAPPEQPLVPASPAPDGPAPKTPPPAPPVTIPAVAVPDPDVTEDTPEDDNAPTPATIDPEAETKLTAEIVELWGKHKDGKTAARRTRAELKTLKRELSAKLHIMKTILVRTGRGGGWAAYLRLQHLPVTTADRYVAQHEASLAPPAEKDPTGELTVDEVRQLAKKLLRNVSRLLSTQELVYEFMHTLIWGIDVAEMSYTDAGFEIPKVGSDDAPEADMQAAELANPAPVVP